MNIQYAHSNHGLFADHYLNDILPELEIWTTTDEEVQNVFNQIQKLYFDKKEFLKPDIPEDAVEKEFIEPILDIINPHYVLRPPKKGGVRRWVPDYGLCPTDEAKRKTYKHIQSSGVFKDVMCILEAKRWERPLDKKLKKGKSKDDPDNPTLQITNYLLRTGTQWGILTNGRLWRIYERDQSAGMEKWYEVDLVRILDPSSQQSLDFEPISQLDAFKYFYLFFRLQAFPDFLQKVLDESVDYELKVSEDLKENVYKALRLLAEGFVQSNPEQFDRDKDKDLIRRKCFVLLYRILFILFAESKPYKAQERLLPRGISRYDEDYSLWNLRHRIADKAGEDKSKLDYGRFLDTRCEILERIKDLFHLVDVGSEHEDFKIPKSAFHVPAYNGGLFDSTHFDDTWKITDRYLGQVIDLLSRAPKKKNLPVLHFIDYGYLDVDKLGGIYEGLLENRLEIAEDDIVPAVVDGKERWIPIGEAKGLKKVKWGEQVKKGEYYPVTDRGERKTSGSYYTPSILVDYIVEHALEPIIQQSIDEIEPECKKLERQLKKRDKQGMEGEVIKLQKKLDELLPRKILSLRILDPAMGSGHFLVNATKYLAKRLTELSETEESEPDANDYRIAKRRIVENCIFGVDKNELAVELAKVSLWIETVARDHALSFLDHHLRWGDSLLGTTIDSLQKLRHERKTPTGTTAALFSAPLMPFIKGAIELYTTIERTPSKTAHEVKHKENLLKDARDLIRPFREVADIWMADWFTDIDREDYESAHVNLQIKDKEERDKEFEKLRKKDWFKEVQGLYDKHRFFHWELEFPEAYFDEKGKRLKDPGFDAVIGNPPWERIRLEEVQFFMGRFPQIALAPRASDRKRMIKELEEENPKLWDEYREAKDDADHVLRFLHKSGFYPLMGRGDTNFYAVFAERAASVVRQIGRVGFLTPSGIATDNTTQYFFQELVDNHRLSQLLDFENKKEFFAEIHSSFKFSIVLFGGTRVGIETIRMAFFLHRKEFEELIQGKSDKVVELHPDDFSLFNPNTRTCPIFRTQRDYELTKKIYKSAPILIDRRDAEENNPWGISFLRMFDMTNDSHLFKTAEELEGDGFYLIEGNVYKKGEDVLYLPLYEGKMIWHFDHRFSSLEQGEKRVVGRQVSNLVETGTKEDPKFSPMPRYWVPSEEVKKALDNRQWSLGFRDISNATNERTFVATVFPRSGASNKLPLLLSNVTAKELTCSLGNLCSFVFDYSTRNKMMGTTLNYFIVEQLPVLPPEKYDEKFHGKKLIDFISPKVLELCYTAHDLAGFAQDMGHVDKNGNVKPPFKWDEERRFHLRCQLDALYFILYGLDTDEAEEILETFPIVKREDEKRYGRYRTRDLIINYMRAYEAGDLNVRVKG